jgi:hypothetical protein
MSGRTSGHTGLERPLDGVRLEMTEMGLKDLSVLYVKGLTRTNECKQGVKCDQSDGHVARKKAREMFSG